MEPSLERELSFLRKLYATTNKRKTTEDLIINVLGFLAFWVIGALIFSRTEVRFFPLMLAPIHYLPLVMDVWTRPVFLLPALFYSRIW